MHHEAKSAEAILFIFTTFTFPRQEKFATIKQFFAFFNLTEKVTLPI
jgi:hypothetical protein